MKMIYFCLAIVITAPLSLQTIQSIKADRVTAAEPSKALREIAPKLSAILNSKEPRHE